MLAKVIVGGPSRSEALARLEQALAETVVLGVVTNLHFLRWLAGQPIVQAGEARIDTLEQIWPPAGNASGNASGKASAEAPSETAWQAAAAAIATLDGDGWRLNGPARIRLELGGLERSVELDVRGGGPLAVLDETGTAFVDDDGRSVAFRLAPPPDVDRAARSAAGQATGGAVEVRSPMPGRVLAVHVGPGTTVAAGQALVTVEAMKMEHVVTSPSDGTIDEVLVARGEQVNRGQPLVGLTAGTRGATVVGQMEEQR